MKSPLFSKREDVSGTKSMSGGANAGNTLRRNAVYCAYCAGIILCGIVLGFVLLLLVELLPKGSMVRHMQESVSVLAEEGSYPVLSSFRMSTLDNVTDALILGSAAYDGEGSLLDTVLLRYRYICSLDGEALDGLNSLIAYYSGYPGLETSTGDYPRYWHGYLLYVKPLLCLLNYQQIRTCDCLFVVEELPGQGDSGLSADLGNPASAVYGKEFAILVRVLYFLCRCNCSPVVFQKVGWNSTIPVFLPDYRDGNQLL